MANPELIRKLTEIQARNKLTDGEMAQTLGCSRQLYNATKMGKISIGLTILRGIKQSFPELSSSILISLDNATAGNRTNRPQARQNAPTASFFRKLRDITPGWVKIIFQIGEAR